MNYDSIYAFELTSFEQKLQSVHRKLGLCPFVDFLCEGSVCEFDSGLYMVDM